MKAPRRSFIFGPKNNSKHGLAHHDATGAFHVGMRIWKELYGGGNGTVVSHYFLNGEGLGPAKVQDGILNAMRQGSGGQYYDAICYFGHGTKAGMESAGWYAKSIDTLTSAIDELGAPDVKVMLYACSCASPGGIAYRMANDLRAWWQSGTEVHGHLSPGHTFANPQYRRYPNAGGETGFTVAPPKKVAGWVKAIRNQRNTLWARYPFMTPDEIEAEL
jgi:hypothetical protein